MKRREVLKIMAEFPTIGAIGAFASPNPRRNDPTRYNLVNADQLIAGSLFAQRIKGGTIEGSAIDIPESGVNGFHVDSTGALGIGGTSATDSSSEFRVSALGSVGIFNSGLLEMYGSVSQSIPSLTLVSDDDGLGRARITLGEGTGDDVNIQWDGTKVSISQHVQIGLAASPSYLQLVEMVAPASPSSNSVRIFSQDNGAGKTQLMALFSTGAAQQIAIQP